MEKIFCTSLGEDSHRVAPQKTKPLILGGIVFEKPCFCLEANSDGDVVLHAVTNAISGITGVNILGKIADTMCQDGITNSAAYLKKALEYMPETHEIHHVSISIEALRPKFAPHIDAMRHNIAALLGLDYSDVCIQATTGEGLTEFGKGNGIFVKVLMSFSKIK